MIKLALNHKYFGQNLILSDLHLEIDDTDRIAIVGKSGKGKTTLIRILAGLDRDFSGQIQNLQATRMAVMFQEPSLLPWLSAVHNLMVCCHLSKPQALTWLDRVGLEGKGDAYPAHLSLGQQRRIAFARTLAFAEGLEGSAESRILLLDEPFTSLDKESKDKMIGLLQEFLNQQPTALILASHEETELSKLTHRQIMI